MSDDEESQAAFDAVMNANWNYPLLQQEHGFQAFVRYLGGVIAESGGEGWHTFTMNIKADGETAVVDDVSLLPAGGGLV